MKKLQKNKHKNKQLNKTIGMAGKIEKRGFRPDQKKPDPVFQFKDVVLNLLQNKTKPVRFP